MDRALKERIIGAVILVLFVVLVVPVFLDGPPDEGEILTERVALPGQSEQTVQTIVLERDRDDPVPAAASNDPPDPEPQAIVVKEKPAPAPTRKAPPSADPEPQTATAEKKAEPSPAKITSASATGMWAVQLGSFGNEDNAERLAADLRKQGFAAFLSQLSSGDAQLHRVRIGPQKDRESAEAMAERLRKAGHKGQVVPHP